MPEEDEDFEDPDEEEEQEDADDTEPPSKKAKKGKKKKKKEEPQRTWRKEDVTYPSLPPFTHPTPPCLRTPFEYFEDMFTSDIVDDIVYQTNLYARQKNVNTTFMISIAPGGCARPARLPSASPTRGIVSPPTTCHPSSLPPLSLNISR